MYSVPTSAKSKVVRSVRLWERLSTEGVLEEFERNEIKSTSLLTPPRSNEWAAALFADADTERIAHSTATSQETERVSRRNAFLATTTGVKDEKRFTSFNPESEQTLVAEMRFLRTLKAKRMWHKAADAWVTGFLPRRALIHLKYQGLYVFVVKAYECAALCWDAHLLEHGVWEKSTTIQRLSWHTIFGFDEVEVIPTENVSPLHAFVQVSPPPVSIVAISQFTVV